MPNHQFAEEKAKEGGKPIVTTAGPPEVVTRRWFPLRKFLFSHPLGWKMPPANYQLAFLLFKEKVKVSLSAESSRPSWVFFLSSVFLLLSFLV
jgi:hypothetical protein